MEGMSSRFIIIIMVYTSTQLLVSEGIQHRTLAVNGINMHIAEEGQGPVVLLLHGYPEFWYTWRHQIVALAAHGFRAVAPDLRGYGDTDAPLSANNYTSLHIVGGLVALIDDLGQDQVFLVGHDFGAVIAWYFCMFRPDRIKALINLSVAFPRRNPSVKPIQYFHTVFGDDYYICRFQEPGEIEEEYNHIGVVAVIRASLTLRDPGPPIIPKGKGIPISANASAALPTWLTAEDIDYYAKKFQEKGFTGGLNYYRALDLNWEVTAPWTGGQVKVPAKFIVGDLDMAYNSPGIKEYIHGDGFKKDVPLLKEVVVMKGVAHFINQEKADEINKHICDFIKKF